MHRPIIVATLCAAVQFAIVVAILLIGKAALPHSLFGAVKLTAFATTVIFPVILATAFGQWRSIGLLGKPKKSVETVALCLTPALLFLVFGLKLPASAALLNDLGIQVVNAFGEELLFRGVIFLLLLQLSPVRSIIINGVLFGAMHLIHGFMDGNWPAALVQAGVSTIAGMMFTAMRYRTESVWPPMIVHMLLNLAIMYSNVADVAGPTALIVVERLADLLEFGIAAYLMVRLGKLGGGRAASEEGQSSWYAATSS